MTLRINSNGLFLLLIRDLKSSPLLTLRSFLTPLSFPLFYLYIGGIIYQTFFSTVMYRGVIVPYTLYLAIGLIIIQIYQGANLTTSLFWSDIRINMLSQLKHMGFSSRTYFLSKMLMSAIISGCYGLFFYFLTLPICFYTGFFYSFRYDTIIIFIFILFFSSLFFISYYFLISSIVKDIDSYTIIITTTLFPLMFLSNVFYPIDKIPSPWNNIFYWNPLSIFARILRDALLNFTVNEIDLIIGFLVMILFITITFHFFEKKYHQSS